LNDHGSAFDGVATGVTHRWRIGIVLICASAALFGLANRRDVPNLLRTLTTARPAWCVTAGVLMVVWMANNVCLQWATLRATGVRMKFREVAVGAEVAHFLNLTTKSAGAAGLAGFRAEARRSGLPENSVTAGYVLGAMLTEWAFAAALLASFVVLATDGHLTATVLVALCVFVLYACGRVGLLVATGRDRARLRAALRLPIRFLAWASHRSSSEVAARSEAAADEFFDSLQLVRSRPRLLIPAAGHAVATEVIAAAILWSCLHAVGASLGPLQSLVAYSVAGLFGIVGFLPGGLGFVEVSLSAVLVGFGANGVTAAASVLLYRLFELWLPVVIGAGLAYRLRVGR